MPRRIPRQFGVTLMEMMIVVALIALGAGIVIPNASPLTAVTNDLATSEVIRAIRFTQREALRTSAWYTVQIDANAQTLRVYRLTTSGTVTEDTSFTVQNPLDKRKYDIAFSAASGPTRAVIAAVDFDYGNKNTNQNQNTLSFGPDGTPGMLLSFKKGGDSVALQAGTVTITYGKLQRVLSVDPITGRVSG